jgi:hypothetical protein
MDLSHLDKKYFIDPYKYNCPFCKRNHVSYELIRTDDFDWGEKKKCYVYFIKCNSCGRESVHFSFEDIRHRRVISSVPYRDVPESIFKEGVDIDSKLFFSQPSSFFVLDSRIPKKIRELVFEAEGCRQANFLVGASACARKAIYELLDHENSIVINEKTKRANYSESIKKLKDKFSFVSAELFDVLGEIQELTSDVVHEGSWESWDSKHLRYLIELLKTILNEMYVMPEEKKRGLSMLSELKQKITKDKSNKDDNKK